MAVKTAKLTGAEAAVTGLDGSIAHIRNDGAGVVLASLKAGITEGADGVLSVPAGTSAALTGISGELHLLGIGSVVIVSNDYAECPFKSAVTLGSVTDEISRAAGGSNLLMNPDFRINQRGKSEYSTGYTVDRWYISTDKCKAAPESDGIRLTASVALASNTHAFWQNLEFPPAGGEYTLSLNVPEVSGVWSARIRTVNASGDYVDSYYTSLLHKGVNKVSVDLSESEYISAVSVGINKGTEAGNSLKLAWVKLESGSLATPFVPPDPATELAKCQRYLYVLRGSLLRAGLAEAYSTSYALFYLYAPASFRTVPSVSFENVVLSSTKDGSVYSEAASIQVRGCNSNAVKLLVNAADSLTIGEQYELSHKPDTTGSIILSAEL